MGSSSAIVRGRSVLYARQQQQGALTAGFRQLHSSRPVAAGPAGGVSNCTLFLNSDCICILYCNFVHGVGCSAESCELCSNLVVRVQRSTCTHSCARGSLVKCERSAYGRDLSSTVNYHSATTGMPEQTHSRVWVGGGNLSFATSPAIFLLSCAGRVVYRPLLGDGCHCDRRTET